MRRALRVLQQRAAATSERVRASVAEGLVAGELAATRTAHRALDAEVARVLARDPAAPPACAAGCSYCCHVNADATRGEVLAVAEHIRATRTPKELSSFVEALASTVRLVSTMGDDDRWSQKIPCALLGHDGRCTVYEARPLRCRAFHSNSAEVCREAFTGPIEPAPDTNPVLDRACDEAEAGYHRALEEHGISAAPVLLEAALLRALT